eukprot:NODE_1257_length_1808_cov_127.343620_g1192_i0.p1 GENE.NODE_1257_length_1808_cov_127.343620_g1192_i0~~NODE_1257_length_1808_cov_127.343620_g1192_i0.p1  ORF type:complete len:381 (+),score=44.96 NODE_1257_length_1808_cov_127.343620_g1192_i0:568-1710(+)
MDVLADLSGHDISFADFCALFESSTIPTIETGMDGEIMVNVNVHQERSPSDTGLMDFNRKEAPMFRRLSISPLAPEVFTIDDGRVDSQYGSDHDLWASTSAEGRNNAQRLGDILTKHSRTVRGLKSNRHRKKSIRSGRIDRSDRMYSLADSRPSTRDHKSTPSGSRHPSDAQSAKSKSGTPPEKTTKDNGEAAAQTPEKITSPKESESTAVKLAPLTPAPPASAHTSPAGGSTVPNWMTADSEKLPVLDTRQRLMQPTQSSLYRRANKYQKPVSLEGNMDSPDKLKEPASPKPIDEVYKKHMEWAAEGKERVRNMRTNRLRKERIEAIFDYEDDGYQPPAVLLAKKESAYSPRSTLVPQPPQDLNASKGSQRQWHDMYTR